jgi:phage tail tape-measure protein
MASTNTDSDATPSATSRILELARQTAQDAKPVVAQVKPLASDTKDAAARGLLKARTWAAPQVEHTGQVLQDSVAPKVAAALTSTAQRLEPDKAAPHGHWRKVAGVSALLAAAAAIVIALRNRIAPGTTAEADEDEPAPAEPMQASADGAAPKPARTS